MLWLRRLLLMVINRRQVKADGEILDCLSTLKKDNTGYHLKHLFIGSEGTLGFVTKVAIQCPPKPRALNMAFLGKTANILVDPESYCDDLNSGTESFEKVLETFKRAKRDLGEILSSFELIDAKSLDVVTGYFELKSPVKEFPFYILIETQGSNTEHDEAKMNSFLEKAWRDETVLDGIVTNEPSKMKVGFFNKRRKFQFRLSFACFVDRPCGNYGNASPTVFC